MRVLIVVDNPARWPIHVPGVEVVAARRYLTDPLFSTQRGTRLFNLCPSYAYQSLGYYVSLLAEARGHKPTPDVVTIQDMKSASLVRAIADDLDRLIQRSLHRVPGPQFTLSIYFGRTLAKRDRQLGLRLFGLFRSPLLRAQFAQRRGKWVLQAVRPIPASEVPDAHHPDVIAAAESYFSRKQWTGPVEPRSRYDLAILIDPEDDMPPSDEPALRKFVRAAERQGFGVEMITRDDFGHVGEFDALFIRTTTYVNHYTYRFARRAAAEGLVVIDDPVSIARCTNKVYLAERLTLAKVPVPRTLIIHRDNVALAPAELGFPIVLKQPDSAFSVGVSLAHNAEEYQRKIEALLEDSEMVVAQPFIPTPFDWRVGLIDGQPLYVCKYHMAHRHWQITKHGQNGQRVEGKTTTFAVEDAPARVVRTAVRAAALIGDGLYGVDIKEIDGKPYVIEVNDNPSLDSGGEDAVLKDGLYDRIMASFARRIEQQREAAAAREPAARTSPV